ncbi:hypothetical protein [Streptosporangium sp. NPDC006007]|uniref:tetratricopeptide repeat protein n=1 Tax=Streptosporangium sp. NPDC006007 TaxID=3154575 RepID=UPI0033B58F64
MLAGNRVRREAGRPAERRFGPLSAALIGPENAIIAGRPGKAIALFKRLPRSAGLSDLSTWDRARLDAARAHIQIGDPRRATEILSELKRAAPEWLRHQQAGQDTVRELLDVMPRLTAEQRAPASFYEIT